MSLTTFFLDERKMQQEKDARYTEMEIAGKNEKDSENKEHIIVESCTKMRRENSESFGVATRSGMHPEIIRHDSQPTYPCGRLVIVCAGAHQVLPRHL